MLTHWELLFRLAAGMLLGGVIGYERDIHGRPAGLRTHMIVGLASATFMVVSTQFIYFQRYGHDDLVGVDASRIASSVVSGMGFLAGGAILRSGVTVQGLTTAAGLWLVAAIGLCAGGGLFVEGAFVTFCGVAALTLFRRFEDKDDNAAHHRLLVELDDGTPFRPIASELVTRGIGVSDVEVDVSTAERRVTHVCDLRVPSPVDVDVLVDVVRGFAGVRRLRLEPRR